MTRPVGEPSWSKAQGEQDFGIRQLFRRPKPLTGEPTQYFRAYKYISNIVRTTGGSQTVVDWDFWEFCDEDVFTPLNTSLQPDPVPGVDQVRRVRLDPDTYPGKYDFFFGAAAFPAANGSLELAMHDGDDTWGVPDVVYHAVHTSYGGGFYVLNLVRIYPIVDPFGGTNDPPEISFTVAQVTGSNMTFNPLWFEIHYTPNVDMCPEGSS